MGFRVSCDCSFFILLLMFYLHKIGRERNTQTQIQYGCTIIVSCFSLVSVCNLYEPSARPTWIYRRQLKLTAGDWGPTNVDQFLDENQFSCNNLKQVQETNNFTRLITHNWLEKELFVPPW